MLKETWVRKVFDTELYYDIPKRDAHCEDCLELEIGCKVEDYSDLKTKTGKSFEDLVLERLGVEEWGVLGTRSQLESQARMASVPAIQSTPDYELGTAEVV